MRFLILIKATNQYEAGLKPDDSYQEAMAAYLEHLAAEGRLLAAEHLEPSSFSIRLHPVSGVTPSLKAGPFQAGSELLAGYVQIEAESMTDALAWANRLPLPYGGTHESEIEIRQMKTKKIIQEKE